MFNGFEQKLIDVGDAKINLKTGGQGPALLLLHGFPQSHVHWHLVAPILATDFTLVIPDLRGYGDSIGPGPDPEHHNYCKRTMANDMVSVMEQLGFNEFRLAGHDRGARVAYRLTLDHPERVTHLASIDVVPTLDVWEAMDMTASINAFHWPFLAQPAPVPETMIGAAPEFFLHHLLERWVGDGRPLAESAIAEYSRHISKASVVEAMVEDYRAGATIDLLHDQQDRVANKRITCPVFVPWGRQYMAKSLLPIWQRWADNVYELPLDCGHFIAEEEPEVCAEALIEFFSR
jgi:haloacetate dehalogenase